MTVRKPEGFDKIMISDTTKIKNALIEGAKYYGVPYPTGITVRLIVGRTFVYNHADQIVCTGRIPSKIDAMIARATIRARKEMS